MTFTVPAERWSHTQDVPLNTTAIDIRRSLCGKWGIGEDALSVRFAGQAMPDMQSLLDCRIQVGGLRQKRAVLLEGARSSLSLTHPTFFSLLMPKHVAGPVVRRWQALLLHCSPVPCTASCACCLGTLLLQGVLCVSAGAKAVLLAQEHSNTQPPLGDTPSDQCSCWLSVPGSFITVQAHRHRLLCVQEGGECELELVIHHELLQPQAPEQPQAPQQPKALPGVSSGLPGCCCSA